MSKLDIDRQTEIKVCLDEIEAAYVIMGKSNVSEFTLRTCRGWVRRHKERLKELKYRGKVPRKAKS